jgi:hypothetical protein
MPKSSDYDAERLRGVLQAQRQVVTRTQALLCGMPHSTVDRYAAPGGRWQRLLPGVYLALTGSATQDQRDMAALLYAGRRSLLTGSAAMRRHHLRPAGPDLVDVLIPWERTRQSTGFVRICRTQRMRSGLPRPVFNAQLFDADGIFIATVDAWWPEAGVAAEIDSRAYHLAAADQDRTTERHDKLAAHGILTLHFPPRRVKTDAAGIVSELQSAIDKGLARPRLPITAVPQAA